MLLTYPALCGTTALVTVHHSIAVVAGDVTAGKIDMRHSNQQVLACHASYGVPGLEE